MSLCSVKVKDIFASLLGCHIYSRDKNDVLSFFFFFKCRLSPCEWSQAQGEQNTFSFLHSLWYTAGALALQGKQHPSKGCKPLGSRDLLICIFLCTLSGAGPHPKALSGRVICCTWWLFTIVLLACYFSNLSSAKAPESTQLTVKGFDDLANQDVIEYGCLAGSSTLAFFKVQTVWGH